VQRALAMRSTLRTARRLGREPTQQITALETSVEVQRPCLLHRAHPSNDSKRTPDAAAGFSCPVTEGLPDRGSAPQPA
jgi:hypothetical protein